MNSLHDVQVGKGEEDRLEVEVVAGKVGRLCVIGWVEEGEGMARLQNTDNLPEGLSLTDLHWLDCRELYCRVKNFHKDNQKGAGGVKYDMKI